MIKFPFTRTAPSGSPASSTAQASSPDPKLASAEKSSSGTTTTATIFPLAQIHEDCVELKDHTWVAVLGVQGVLFDWLSDAEQDRILYRYQGFLHGLHAPIQILAATEPIPLEHEISYLEGLSQRQADAILKSFGLAIAHLLSEHTSHLERIIYAVAVPASTHEHALITARAVRDGLSGVHQDLRPTLLTKSALVELWARMTYVTLPGPPEAYRW